MEKELDKLEKYQEYLNEELKDADAERDGDFADSRKAEQRILRKGKWKARFHNALTAIGILIAFTIVSGIITSIFYSTGKTPKIEIYRDVVASTIALTQPNTRMMGGGSSIQSFFSLKLDSELYKQVGNSEIMTGEINVLFLLNQAGYPQRKSYQDNNMAYSFIYPGSPVQRDSSQDWNRLEKLPEGTVVECYISLDRLYHTDEILGKFKGRDMNPLWFAVDTGFDKFEETGPGPYPIGFPYNPIWHSSDWTITQHTEKKWGLFGKSVMESKKAPELDPYGSGQLREDNFKNTLKLLEKYKNIADRIAVGPDLQIDKRLQYIDSHGINIYGLVVTGPTKEVLKLKNETWVSSIQVGEARLWDWK